jgi:lipopolysaccharide export system permease protein
VEAVVGRLDRYIARTVIGGSLIALLIILSLNIVFEFVDETGDVGEGSYTTSRALLYVLLSLPYRAYEALPFATLIGSLMALGALAGRHELVAMRAAGMSVVRIARAVLLGGLVLALVAVALGEWVAPTAERMAQALRASALEGRVSSAIGSGFWVRDGGRFLNVARAPEPDVLEDVVVYELEGTRLARILRARVARYDDGRWRLAAVRETRFRPQQVVQRRVPELVLEQSSLRPEMLEVIVVEPATLPIADVLTYIDYLQSNGLDSDRYWLAVWVKVATPLATLTMLLLTVPLVLGSQRSTRAGQRLFIGVLVGLAFFLLNRLLANAGVIYGLPPMLSALGPTLLFLALGAWGLRRVR